VRLGNVRLALDRDRLADITAGLPVLPSVATRSISKPTLVSSSAIISSCFANMYPAAHLYSEQENTSENWHENRGQEDDPHREPASIEELASRLMVGQVENRSGSMLFGNPYALKPIGTVSMSNAGVPNLRRGRPPNWTDRPSLPSVTGAQWSG
jgi:hypothetical protein